MELVFSECRVVVYIINMFTVVKCKHNHNSMHNMSNLPL